MKNIFKQCVLCIGLMSAVTPLQGCFMLLVGAAGVGTIAYIQGVLEQNYGVPVAKLHKATLKGLKKMDCFVYSEKLEKHESHIKAETKDAKEITIDIEALTERSSKIKIRVGLVGDEKLSRLILASIEGQL